MAITTNSYNENYERFTDIMDYDFKDIENCNNETVVVECMSKYKFPGGFSFIDSDLVMNDFYIEKVIYNNPATIVIWSDGTKTVSKTHAGDVYCPEVGLVLCVLKKIHGNTNVHDLISLWTPIGNESVVTISDVRKRGRKNG